MKLICVTFIFILVLTTTTGWAYDVGGVRALRIGPVGASPAVEMPRGIDHEAFLQTHQNEGQTKAGEDKIDHTDDHFALWAGSEFLLNPASYFQMQLSYQSREYASKSKTATYENQIETSYWEIAAGPGLDLGDLRLAARVTIRGFADESRKLITEDGEQKQTIERAVVPIAEATVGLESGPAVMSLGLQTYGGKKVDAAGTNALGETVAYETRRQIPAEARLDASLRLTTGLKVAVGITRIFAGQLGTDADEYSLLLADDTDADSRILSGKVQPADHFQLHLGTTLEANREVTFIGALGILEDSFASNELASPAENNIGGIDLDIGAHYLFQRIRGFFNLSYEIGNDHGYRAENGTDVSIESGGWELTLGTGISY